MHVIKMPCPTLGLSLGSVVPDFGDNQKKGVPCLQVCQEYTLIMGGLRAARKLHARLLARVMRLPMSFFDSQPTGRLLNRFTRDTESVDIAILVRFSSLFDHDAKFSCQA